MNPQEKQDVIRTSAIIRTARKLRGKTQIEVANYLGVSQSFLSKLEHGRLIPSSSQWFYFCRFTEINPTATFDSGFIDHRLPVAEVNPYPQADFKVDEKYLDNQASKVRAIRPFINYFIQKLGHDKFIAFCQRQGVDPDFFWVLDNQTNIRFTLDLVTFMIQQGALKATDIPMLAQPISQPAVHGILHEEYDRLNDSLELIECLIQNKHKYEANFAYKLEQKDKNKITLSVSPNAILSKFDYQSDILGDFLCRYKQQFFKYFSSYGGHSQPAHIEEKQCLYHGHDKCVYEIQVAA